MSRARLRALAPRVARLSIFLVVVAVGLHFVLGRVVRAQVESTLLHLGAGILKLEAATGARDPSGRGPRVLELNGARLQVSAEGSDESVEEVLDRAEAACAPGDEGRPVRGADGGRGFVACFVPPPVVGEGAAAAPSYRYVYAEPGGERTVVVSVIAEGDVELARLFPPDGEAPGADAPGLPRPPGSRRVLSAREHGAPQQMTLYMAEEEPAALEAWYRAELPALGWRPLETGREQQGPRVLVVDRAGTLAALVFDREQTGGSSVAILTSL